MKLFVDHLEIHIAPLNITIPTALGKMLHSDALYMALAAIEQCVMQEVDL
ncbi:MAG: hypothetical protein ACXVDN_02645 [Ktedonobacteraceae bacterium]